MVFFPHEHNRNKYLEGIITMILATQFSYLEKRNKFGERKMYETSIAEKKIVYKECVLYKYFLKYSICEF